MPAHRDLSRRERQIMEFIYRQPGEAATAAEIQAGIPDSPGYSAIRALLRILERKGHVRHREDGRRYVYEVVQSRDVARRFALGEMVKTFFGGAPDAAIAALLDLSGKKLSKEQLERLEKQIKDAKREGR
jgi:BlaI family penicillinase repressor